MTGRLTFKYISTMSHTAAMMVLSFSANAPSTAQAQVGRDRQECSSAAGDSTRAAPPCETALDPGSASLLLGTAAAVAVVSCAASEGDKDMQATARLAINLEDATEGVNGTSVMHPLNCHRNTSQAVSVLCP